MTATRVAAPQWMIDLHQFRQQLFLRTVEPVIVALLGPVEEVEPHQAPVVVAAGDGISGSAGAVRAAGGVHPASFGYADDEWASHRRLGFLPNYVEDVGSFRDTSMSFATLAMMFVVMSCLLLVLLSCFYHNQKTSPLFISPRRHRLPKLVPPPLPVDGAFSWVKVCFFMSDEEIINRIGYDSLIFLRFHRLALRCIVKMSVFSFIVLLPLNFTGGGHANASDLKGYVGSLLFTDFLRFTMANVNGGSPRLWVHCFAAYLLTGIVVRELLVEYNAFNNIRHRYLLSKEPHLRTVLVTNIPRHLRAPRKISTYFRHVYPEAVKSVSMCQNLIRLEKLVAKRTGILAQIENELLVLCRREKRSLLGQYTLRSCLSAMSPCFVLEKIGLLDGAQERLAKLYSSLEEINNLVEQEQTRRRRVMKKMDRMEAASRSDIDYVLASPFAGDYAQGKKAPNDDAENPHSFYRPPAIGAPRNPDGTVGQANSAPSTLGKAPRNGNPGVPPEAEVPDPGRKNRSASEGEPDFLSEPIGPARRSGSTALNDDADEMGHFQSLPTHGMDPSSATQGHDDANAKKIRRPYSKAKHAIRRYSRLIKNRTFLGRPKDPVDISVSYSSEIDSSRSFEGHIEDHTNEVTDKAFIVMRTYTASTIAIQSMHSSKPGSMQVTTAPEPRDVLWQNVYVSKGARRTRSYIGEGLVLFLITFYIVPVALVSLLVSESALISSSPRLAQLDQASAFFSAAIATVQPLCLVGIQQLLPPLFIQISKAEGLVSFSEVQMRAFSRYFLFQVLNVFLVTAIAGSIFDTLAIIIENPEAAFELLGNSLPRMSSFFITFVTMKAFLGLGVELVRIMSLVQASLRSILFPNMTLRAHRSVRIGMRAIDDPGWFPFHKILAQDMLVVVISVVFAVVAPIVLFPCALFCMFSRIMWTHHHLYVYESVFETGGQFWPKIFRRFVFGLIIAQMTITGQFILKEARHEAYATIALMFLTYIFLRSTRARYDAASSTLPLEVATVMDISVSQEEAALQRKQQEMAAHLHQEPISSFESNKSMHGSNALTGQTRLSVLGTASIPESSDVSPDEAHNDSLGAVIGQEDPFEHAYLQPALRANPRARPEQPFPPAQLGREEVFMGKSQFQSSTTGIVGDDDVCDGGATVRLKSLNQQDRRLVDRWWNDQLQRCENQNWFRVFIGEECGTLLVGRVRDAFASHWP